jgi:site-specific recombinase XerD
MNQITLQPATPMARQSEVLSDCIIEELRRYDEHLCDVRGLAVGTRRDRDRIVGRLLHHKFAGGLVDIARAYPEDVRRFIAEQLDACRSPSNTSQLAAALRGYFRYRTTFGDQVGPLTAVITNPVHWWLASLPRALKPSEADRLLKSFASLRANRITSLSESPSSAA